MDKETMKKMGFEKEMELIGESKCPFCEKTIDAVTEFKDSASEEEYRVSGLCQLCQDDVFGG